MALEASTERRYRDGLKIAGCWSIKLWPMSYAGIPDRLVMLPIGRVVFVELKRAGKDPTPRQVRTHARLRRMRFPVAVLRGTPDVTAWMRILHSALGTIYGTKASARLRVTEETLRALDGYGAWQDRCREYSDRGQG